MYSIACASKPDGSIDKDTVMVRGRQAGHLRNLQTRFPALAGTIVTLPNRDYRYRIIVPKSVWVAALGEMAEEQQWGNFKNQVAKHQGRAGAAYANALHEVWAVMYRLQECQNAMLPGVENRESSKSQVKGNVKGPVVKRASAR